MEKILLGRTGLMATVAGLGCGGHSRLGLKQFGQDHAAALVRKAYDSGVNFFDTATVYGTQGAVGQGLGGLQRESYILSTKFPYKNDDDTIKTPEMLRATLEESLKLLETDYIDIYHLHGVHPSDYDEVIEKLLPAMEQAQRAGKIRYLGITEVFAKDTSHEMLVKALADDYFDVMMVGCSLLNPSAGKTVLPMAMEKNVGVLCMFAVRSALSNPEQLKTDIGRILAAGQGDPAILKAAETLSFLPESGHVKSITEAAYRFCRHTPGIHVVLTGTGNPEHLAENLKDIQMPALPREILERLEALFGRVDCVSGQ